MEMARKKQRGQKRKLSTLLTYIDEFQAFENTNEKYEHFHVPCSNIFINSKKTNSKIKTIFCKKWIETTENFIKQKPLGLEFCKIISFIKIPDLWGSEIIIFYDEDYYKAFWDRATTAQVMEKITNENTSFTLERGITTQLKEIGYIEIINDEDYSNKSVLWFYGEL